MLVQSLLLPNQVVRWFESRNHTATQYHFPAFCACDGFGSRQAHY